MIFFPECRSVVLNVFRILERLQLYTFFVEHSHKINIALYIINNIIFKKLKNTYQSTEIRIITKLI